MSNAVNGEKIYTVLELNTLVRDAIKRSFPGYVWVSGEIKDFRASRDKKHIYFELVQKHLQGNEVVAQVKAALFQTRQALIFQRIKDTGQVFELRNDIEVKFLCEVDLYPPSGLFTLKIIDIDPVYTLGKVAQHRQKIIEDLKRQGLLEKNKTKIFSLLPLKIGLITACDSAAYHDFVNELSISNYGFKVIVNNCYMQGKLVEDDIVAAINYFDAFSFDDLDVVAITRGGGSTADLSWFDNKKIAEAVANCRFPVLSALGHQINETITDMVAHTAVKTPTKAAQFLIERVVDFLQIVAEKEEDIILKTGDLLDKRRNWLEATAVKLDSNVFRYFRMHREDLLLKEQTLGNWIKSYFIQERQTVMNAKDFLISRTDSFIKEARDFLKHSEEKIRLLDPRTILKRGYSITLNHGKAVKTIESVKKGDIIESLFYKGSILSSVNEKKDKE